jgi:hypothetical protein
MRAELNLNVPTSTLLLAWLLIIGLGWCLISDIRPRGAACTLALHVNAAFPARCNPLREGKRRQQRRQRARNRQCLYATALVQVSHLYFDGSA